MKLYKNKIFKYWKIGTQNKVNVYNAKQTLLIQIQQEEKVAKNVLHILVLFALEEI